MIRLDGTWQQGCELDGSEDEGPVYARLAHLAQAAGAPTPVVLDGLEAALRALRASLPSPQVPRTLVISGGEPARLVDSLVQVGSRGEDRVVLIPADAAGDPALDSLGVALRESASDGLPALVVSGAINAGGGAAPLGIMGDLCRSTGASLALDVSLAPWAVLDELETVSPIVAIGALDRWDDELPDTWGLAYLGGPASIERGRVLPPGPASIAPEPLRVLDGWLRAALARRNPVRVWPTSGVPASMGIVGFQIAGWSAQEAALVLRESFGVAVDRLPLCAAPLPPARGTSGELLRAVLRPDTPETVVEALVAGVFSLADAGPSRLTVH